MRLDAHADYATDYISKCVYYLENTDAENVFFVIGEFSGNDLVKTAKSDLKPASDANCDLTLENVTVGNTIRAFIWNNGTLFPIDNVDNLALDYTVTE